MFKLPSSTKISAALSSAVIVIGMSPGASGRDILHSHAGDPLDLEEEAAVVHSEIDLVQPARQIDLPRDRHRLDRTHGVETAFADVRRLALALRGDADADRIGWHR